MPIAQARLSPDYYFSLMNAQEFDNYLYHVRITRINFSLSIYTVYTMSIYNVYMHVYEQCLDRMSMYK